MGKVVLFPGGGDIEPKAVLEAAKSFDLDSVTIVGKHKDGGMHIASTLDVYNDEVIGLLTKAAVFLSKD